MGLGRRLLIISGTAIALSLASVPANSASLSGSKCASAGTTRIVKNVKYTCVKSGKWLVWNKGVAVKPANRPTPTPTPELGYAERWNRIDQSALSTFKAAQPASIPDAHGNTFIWQPSERAVPAAVEEIKKRYDFAARWFAPYGKSENPLKIVIGNLNESEWICSVKLAWLDNMIQPDCVAIQSNGRSGIPTAGQSQRGNKQIDMYQVESFESMLRDYFFYARIEHEFVHNVFYAQGRNYQRSVPCWLTEGGAEYVGMLIAFAKNPDLYIQVRNRNVITQRPSLQSITDWAGYLARTAVTDNSEMTGDHCLDVRPEIYHHAILANEYLVLKLGVQGYLGLIKDASSRSWAQAVQTAFGKTSTEFYADMGAYMKQQYDLIATNQWSIEAILRVPYGR